VATQRETCSLSAYVCLSEPAATYGSVYSVNAKNLSTLLWQSDIAEPNDLICPQPTLDDSQGIIYIGKYPLSIIYLNISTRANTIYVGAFDYTYALNATNGTLIW
jgi:outer membrane protein assembly factor BamB